MNTVEYVSKTVNTLTKKHGSHDPFELCDALGIRVRYMQLKKVKGFYFYQSRIRTIVLNAELEEETQRILCAHELGHACLHSDMLINMRTLHGYEPHNAKNASEYEANVFAAELLISDESIKELLENEGESFYFLAKQLSVPAEFIDFKLRVMKTKGYAIDVPYLAQSDFLKGNINNI
ncbi:MAG: ImmA/IrrE family metallo-endopeptidase [Ruminococcaceae bacterium]|nr:ImmA/IrrE family metallo-endopeptidase [Oscillospiraceae bacterium]